MPGNNQINDGGYTPGERVGRDPEAVSREL